MLAQAVILAALPSVQVTVPVVLSKAPEISPFVLEIAKNELSAIYEHGGVAIEWSEADRPSVQPRLVVLFREAETFPIKTDSRALGLALLDTDREAPKTRVLVVFSDRLRRLVACECPIGMGRALGRAIAHEVGHSLKYEARHSERGLMRAEIPRLRWSGTHRTDFYIDAEDTQAILARLER
jgi:hypothetical protein